jgi:hypothetical protein
MRLQTAAVQAGCAEGAYAWTASPGQEPPAMEGMIVSVSELLTALSSRFGR